jgi:hypothetical protein
VRLWVSPPIRTGLRWSGAGREEHAPEKHITSILGKLNLPAAPVDDRRILAVLAYLQS